MEISPNPAISPELAELQGWFRPVHCKSMAAQEVRALLTARKLVQSKLYRAKKRGRLAGGLSENQSNVWFRQPCAWLFQPRGGQR
jgi:hypothetical protein